MDHRLNMLAKSDFIEITPLLFFLIVSQNKICGFSDVTESMCCQRYLLIISYCKWFEPKSISSSCRVIVRVKVVLKRTVVGD